MAEKVDPNARFEKARARAKQETAAETQKSQEALKRRFAAQGLQASGEAIKQEQLAEQSGRSALERRLESIQEAQETEALRRQEIAEGREFAKSEREAGQAFGSEQARIGREFGAEQAQIGREFGAGQAELQRQFAKGERIAGREFGAGQAELQRQFATGERLAGQEFASIQNQEQRKFAEQQAEVNRAFQQDVVLPFQESQFKQQMDLAQKQFDLDKQVTEGNQALAEAEANKKTIFDRIGDAGTAAWNWDGTIYSVDF